MSSSTPRATTSASNLEAGTSTETSPLLLGAPPAPALQQRPSYRKRALSRSQVVVETQSRWYTGLVAGILGVVLIVGGVLLIVLHPHGKNHSPKPSPSPSPPPPSQPGKGKSDTPDYSKLPGPQPGLRNPNYMSSGASGGVATEVGICSEIGVKVLQEGGTATDAAIAAALCIGTTNMFSAGIGGGGFMVIRPSSSVHHSAVPLPFNPTPNCTSPISIDFREAAPAAAYAHMYSARPDDPDFDPARASRIGGLAVGVPGELRGLEAAYKACGGGVSWDRLFAPSVALARESHVGKELARRLNFRPFGGDAFSAWMLDEPEWAEIFAPEGELLAEGGVLKRESYARTLERLGKDGVEAFYTGDMARSIVRSVQDAGGVLTLDDFARYEAKVERAFEGTYRNRTYYTTQYPSGGPVIAHLLNVLETYDDYVDEGRTGLATHRFVEALKFAFAARTEVGDPAFIHNKRKLKQIPTKNYARAVRANITDDRTHELSYYHPRFDVKEDHGTTHLSTIDKWGSAVALTSTVNLLFGSRVLDKETGVILNDEMDDFATPGVPDAFGLKPSPFNYPASYKRPLSSTSPLIMDTPEGDLYLTLGGSGGSRIFGAVAQVIMNLDWGMDVGNAVEQQRVHDQLSPAYVSIESGFRTDLVDELKSRGHNITLFDVNLGIAEVQAVVRDVHTGRIFATSDSRKNGIPAAY